MIQSIFGFPVHELQDLATELDLRYDATIDTSATQDCRSIVESPSAHAIRFIQAALASIQQPAKDHVSVLFPMGGGGGNYGTYPAGGGGSNNQTSYGAGCSDYPGKPKEAQ